MKEIRSFYGSALNISSTVFTVGCVTLTYIFILENKMHFVKI